MPLQRGKTRFSNVVSIVCCLGCLLILFLHFNSSGDSSSKVSHDEREKINQLIEKANFYAPTAIEVKGIKKSPYDQKFTYFVVQPSKPVLCVSFQSCSATGLAMFFNNTREAHSACDWAIQCYNEIPLGFSKFMCARLQQLGVRVVHCAYTSREKIIQNFVTKNYDPNQVMSKKGPDAAELLSQPLLDSKSFNNKILPKPLLYLQIQHILSSYTHVWLLDEDISFSRFDAQGFIETTRCSYHPYPTPLVSQPLIAGNTQVYKYLNKRTWDTYFETYPNQDILTIGTGFIEIQAPFIHTGFFIWYLDTFVKPILLSAHTLGADWGLDCLLCNSATYYAIHKLQWDHHEELVDKSKLAIKWKLSRIVSGIVATMRSIFDADRRQAEAEAAAVKNGPYSLDTKLMTDTPACAIVVKNAPLHHVNDHMMDRIVGRQSKIRLNRALMIILKRVFPAFYQTGGDPLSSPLSGALKYKAKLGDLDQTCLDIRI